VNIFEPIVKYWDSIPVIALNTVYHDATHPSYVTLPVVKMSDIPPNPNITALAFDPNEYELH
jgi:hypothetical protein